MRSSKALAGAASRDERRPRPREKGKCRSPAPSLESDAARALHSRESGREAKVSSVARGSLVSKPGNRSLCTDVQRKTGFGRRARARIERTGLRARVSLFSAEVVATSIDRQSPPRSHAVGDGDLAKRGFVLAERNPTCAASGSYAARPRGARGERSVTTEGASGSRKRRAFTGAASRRSRRAARSRENAPSRSRRGARGTVVRASRGEENAPASRDRSAEAGVAGVNRRRPLESARGESRAKSLEESTSRGPFRIVRASRDPSRTPSVDPRIARCTGRPSPRQGDSSRRRGVARADGETALERERRPIKRPRTFSRSTLPRGEASMRSKVSWSRVEAL